MAESKLRTISIDFAGNGACFYQSPFLSGKFTLKILTLQTYLVGGEEVKTLASFYLHPTVYLDFYRHFTLKNHQSITEVMGEDKKR